IGQGYTSMAAIASAPRADFVTAAQEQLGDFKAARMQVLAHLQTRWLDNVGTDRLMKKTDGLDKGPIVNLPPGLLAATCGCEDCGPGVSPPAYLAALLDYAVRHVRNNGQAIDLPFLTNTFYQPFGDLPADCEEMDKQVRQVRLCIEVLRRY